MKCLIGLIVIFLAGCSSPSLGPDSSTDTTRVYEIIFVGFNSTDMLEAEDQLRRMKGFVSARIQYKDSVRLELSYETKTSGSAINRQLNDIATDLGVLININLSGQRFRVEKVLERKVKFRTRVYDW